MSGRRTFDHLEGAGRKPSAYEIASSALLPYCERGFEVETPVARWYARYQKGSCISCRDWDAFRDPRETTYASYVAHQAAAEQFMDGVTRLLSDNSFTARIGPEWLEVIEKILPPGRYAYHGLQMVSSYMASMAPSSRIALAGLFQSADQLRLVQVLAFRMRQYQTEQADFGKDARALWENDPMWQPMRRIVERLLVTYDWAEAFVAMNLVVKPMLDGFLFFLVTKLAAPEMRSAYGTLTFTLREDQKWQAAWSRALAKVMVAEGEANRVAMERIVAAWAEPMLLAVKALAAAFGPAAAGAFSDALSEIAATCKTEWRAVGLAVPERKEGAP